MRMKTERGMTLVEVIVAIGIFTLLSGGILASLNVSAQYSSSNQVRVELQQELRLAVTRMSSELRQASSSSIVNVDADGTGYSSVEFKIPIGVVGSIPLWTTDTILYQRVVDDDGSRLERVEGAETKIIANNISLLQVRRAVAAPNVIEVSLRAQKDTVQGRTITNNINFFVQLRN